MLFTVAFEHVEQSRLFWQPPCECTPWLWRARRFQVRRLIDRCAGIDVGQALLVVRVISERGRLVEEVRSSARRPLTCWLAGLAGVGHVSTYSRGDGPARRHARTGR